MWNVLALAIAGKGSTLRDYRDAEGNEGSFQDSHKVYGRTGEPCVTCGTPIRMKRIGGRSSHFCPSCQRGRDRRASN
jgi:formamidopyrimidine-DNA glycosylase